MHASGVAAGATALLGVVSLLGGCLSVDAGEPSVESNTFGSDTGETSETASSGVEAPDVPDPLDASDYLDEPCDLLSSSFADELGFKESGAPRDTEDDDGAAAAGPGCEWNLSDDIDSIHIQIQTSNRDRGAGGMAGSYSMHNAGQFDYRIPVAVSEYLAAFADRNDNRDNGECGMLIGIRDGVTFSAISGPIDGDTQKACPRTKQIAEHVIETLEGSQ